MKKAFIILFFITTILVGCGNQNQVEEKVKYINLTSSIDEYMFVMSSVPGLPLDFDSIDGMEEQLSYKVTVDAGVFIQWDDNGRIKEMGNEIILPYKDVTIYWRPDTESLDKKETEHPIDIQVVNKETEEVVEKDNYLISKVDMKYRLMKIVFTQD